MTASAGTAYEATLRADMGEAEREAVRDRIRQVLSGVTSASDAGAVQHKGPYSITLAQRSEDRRHQKHEVVCDDFARFFDLPPR